MMLATFQQFAADNWKGALEILILAVCIYYGYLGLRGTRGLRVLTGLAVLVLGLALLSQLFGLGVISWLLRSLSAIVVLALVVIFQPELRRLLAQIGSHRLFGTQLQQRETVEVLAETTFDLSNRRLGALIAIERGTDIQSHIESGVEVDSINGPMMVAGWEVGIVNEDEEFEEECLTDNFWEMASTVAEMLAEQRVFDIRSKLGIEHMVEEQQYE